MGPAITDLDLFEAFLSIPDPEDVEALEASLPGMPAEAAVRASLVGYYEMREDPSPRERERWLAHRIWFVDNLPRESFSGHPGPPDWPERDKLDDRWMAAAEQGSSDPVLLACAARALSTTRPLDGVKTARLAVAADPEQEITQQALVSAIVLAVGEGAMDRSHLDEALTAAEAGQVLADHEGRRVWLKDLAYLSLGCDERERAAFYSRDMLRAYERAPNHWNRGNAHHHGHLVLGGVALRNGQIDDARAHLKRSAETEGSPQLNSFGPEVWLAEALRRRGFTDDVVAYLEATGRFWELAGDRIETWCAMVKRGDEPTWPRSGILYPEG